MTRLTKFNVLQQNTRALSGMLDFQQYKAGRPQMCWKCQQEKYLKGGAVTMLGGGLRRFVCADCLAAKAARKAEGGQP